VLSRYHEAKENLIGSAEAMPENAYSFRLTPEQRPFGEWIGHTAAGNYFFCSAIKGAAAPDTKYLRGLTTKAELVKALQDSFGYCDEALKGMDDRKALTEIDIAGRRGYPVQSMVSLAAALNEHYGNLVGYLRMKGIVPPSSARTRMRVPERK
jgi:hypothetical protein